MKKYKICNQWIYVTDEAYNEYYKDLEKQSKKVKIIGEVNTEAINQVNSNLSKKQAKRTAEHFQLLTDLENKEQFYGKICGKAFEEQENQYKVRTNGKEKSLVKIQKK